MAHMQTGQPLLLEPSPLAGDEIQAARGLGAHCTLTHTIIEQRQHPRPLDLRCRQPPRTGDRLQLLPARQCVINHRSLTRAFGPEHTCPKGEGSWVLSLPAMAAALPEKRPPHGDRADRRAPNPPSLKSRRPESCRIGAATSAQTLENLPRERPGEVLAVLSIRGEVSENSVGKPVPGFLCQREAELARSVEVESPLDSKPGRDFAFANRLVSVRVWIGSTKWQFRLYEDSKWKSRSKWKFRFRWCE